MKRRRMIEEGLGRRGEEEEEDGRRGVGEKGRGEE